MMKKLFPMFFCGGALAYDICSSADTGFHAEMESEFACYVGTFLTKMLGELATSPKSSMHARLHLLPWLGGETQIEALRTQNARSGLCTVCLGNNATADGLVALRREVSPETVTKYESLKACYMELADAIMDQIPTNKDGSKLVPRGTPFDQTMDIMVVLLRKDGGLRRWTGCEELPEPPKDRKQLPWEWQDVCDPKVNGLTDPVEQGVFCYLASFMSKMMWELTICPPLGPCRKTEEHVRMHFTPYVGGAGPTAAVFTDDIENATCSACYNDTVCAPHQQRWLQEPCCYDNSTTPQCKPELASKEVFLKARQVFDSLNVCYVPLANYFMEGLPKIGHWLVAPEAPETPMTAALRISKDIWRKHGIDACGGRSTGDENMVVV